MSMFMKLLTLFALTLFECSHALSPSNDTNIVNTDLEDTTFTCKNRPLGSYYPDFKSNCRKFHLCAKGEEGEVLNLSFLCTEGSAFDDRASDCLPADNVICDNNNNNNNNTENGEDISLREARRAHKQLKNNSPAYKTSFKCNGKKLGRYYADIETDCRLFHLCTLGQSKSELFDFQFLCLVGTAFDDNIQRCIDKTKATCGLRQLPVTTTTTTTTTTEAVPTTSTETETTIIPEFVNDTIPAVEEEAVVNPELENPEVEIPAVENPEVENYDDTDYYDYSPMDETVDETLRKKRSQPLQVEKLWKIRSDGRGNVVLKRTRRSPQSPTYDFDNLPVTSFTCSGRVIGGYYADIETGCQMYHVCSQGADGQVKNFRFLCSNGTIFSQQTRTCQTWYTVDCQRTEQFFTLNDQLPRVAVDVNVAPSEVGGPSHRTSNNQQQTVVQTERRPQVQQAVATRTQSSHRPEQVFADYDVISQPAAVATVQRQRPQTTSLSPQQDQRQPNRFHQDAAVVVGQDVSQTGTGQTGRRGGKRRRLKSRKRIQQQTTAISETSTATTNINNTPINRQTIATFEQQFPGLLEELNVRGRFVQDDGSRVEVQRQSQQQQAVPRFRQQQAVERQQQVVDVRQQASASAVPQQEVPRTRQQQAVQQQQASASATPQQEILRARQQQQAVERPQLVLLQQQQQRRQEQQQQTVASAVSQPQQQQNVINSQHPVMQHVIRQQTADVPRSSTSRTSVQRTSAVPATGTAAGGSVFAGFDDFIRSAIDEEQRQREQLRILTEQKRLRGELAEPTTSTTTSTRQVEELRPQVTPPSTTRRFHPTTVSTTTTTESLRTGALIPAQVPSRPNIPQHVLVDAVRDVETFRTSSAQPTPGPLPTSATPGVLPQLHEIPLFETTNARVTRPPFRQITLTEPSVDVDNFLLQQLTSRRQQQQQPVITVPRQQQQPQQSIGIDGLFLQHLNIPSSQQQQQQQPSTARISIPLQQQQQQSWHNVNLEALLLQQTTLRPLTTTTVAPAQPSSFNNALFLQQLPAQQPRLSLPELVFLVPSQSQMVNNWASSPQLMHLSTPFGSGFDFQIRQRRSTSTLQQPMSTDILRLPKASTSFTCKGKVLGGYYADVETNCKMFHICSSAHKHGHLNDFRFLCGNDTVFDQRTQICSLPQNIKCINSPAYYPKFKAPELLDSEIPVPNAELFKVRIKRAIAGVQPVKPGDFPDTGFSCLGRENGRFYADAQTNCQLFHLCTEVSPGGRLVEHGFLCPNNTIFDQRSQACDDQTDSLNCIEDPAHYGIDENYARRI